MTRRKILIVEDEVLVRCGLRSMVNWEKLGLDVIGDASNGKEALEIYEKEKPDIVMTDIKMPVMDGLELIEKIREQDQSTRIVLLTCYEEFSYLMRAMKLGVSDYILKLKMKPDEIEKAMEKVCKELEQKNPDSKNETKAVQDKSDLFGQYVFYHQINENTFREQLKKLDFQVSEKSYRICRMEIANYKEVCEKTKDEQGALIQFLIFNMSEEILGKYKNGELIRENEKNYLLLIEETEEDNQKTKTILKEIARVLREHIMAQVCWKISGVGRSWTELSDRYQECKKNETEKQKEDQKAQNLKQLSIEIYKAKEYIDQHLADKLTLNQVAEIVCLSPNYFSSMWKKEMQVGFVDYITEQRVEKAKELFATTDLRTHEVAELTGFGDDSYFSKIFRKVSGKNPGSFRKRNIL